MIKINIWHGTRPLSQREHLLKGIRSFRTQSFRTQVSIRSYPSLSRFVPKFDSIRTQATDRFLPDFNSSYFIRNTSRASAWTDVNCCVRQGSRVKRVLEVQRKLCIFETLLLSQGKCHIFIGKVYFLYLWPCLTISARVSEILFLPLLLLF